MLRCPRHVAAAGAENAPPTAAKKMGAVQSGALCVQMAGVMRQRNQTPRMISTRHMALVAKIGESSKPPSPIWAETYATMGIDSADLARLPRLGAPRKGGAMRAGSISRKSSLVPLGTTRERTCTQLCAACPGGFSGAKNSPAGYGASCRWFGGGRQNPSDRFESLPRKD